MLVVPPQALAGFAQVAAPVAGTSPRAGRLSRMPPQSGRPGPQTGAESALLCLKPLPWNLRWSQWSTDLIDCTRLWREDWSGHRRLVYCVSPEVQEAAARLLSASGIDTYGSVRGRAAPCGNGARQWRALLSRVRYGTTDIHFFGTPRFVRACTATGVYSAPGAEALGEPGRSSAPSKEEALSVAADMERFASCRRRRDLLAGYARLYAAVIRLNWSARLAPVAANLVRLERDFRTVRQLAIMAAWYRGIAWSFAGNRIAAARAFRQLSHRYRGHRWPVAAAAREAAIGDPLMFVEPGR